MARDYRAEVPDGAFHHRISRTVHGVKLGFEWHGGAYIQVCRDQSFKSPKEVINVWDYATDQPRISRTVGAMNAKVDEWISDYGPENLAHDATANW